MQNELYSFSHNAMDAAFEVMIVGRDERYAKQASEEVFREIDSIEQKLSKFVEYSDIARIAVLEKGGSVLLSQEANECLLSALWAHRETGGAFDISMGQGLERLILDPEHCVAEVDVDGGPLKLDLGGIGKGYALDKAAETFSKWEIENTLLSAGPSTVLAVGVNGDEDWSVGLNGEPLLLQNKALSASGKDVQGEHILDTRAGTKALGHEKAWAICPSAAVADALSTAFMVMSTDEVSAFCEKHEDVSAYLLNKDGELISF